MIKMSKEDLVAIRRILRDGISFIPHPDFTDGATFSNPFEQLDRPNIDWAYRYCSNLPKPPVERKSDILSPKQEIEAFVYYNWLRWKANRALANFLAPGGKMTIEDACKIVRMADEIAKVRDTIYAFNVGLITKACKHYLNKYPTIDPRDLWAEGLERLCNIIDCFNPQLGWKLSTYTIRSLYNCYDRFNSLQIKRGSRCRNFSAYDTEDKPGSFVAGIAEKSHENAGLPVDTSELLAAIDNAEVGLTEQERSIINLRYLEPSGREPTWPEIARTVGMDVERTKNAFRFACQKLFCFFTGETRTKEADMSVEDAD